MEDSTTISEIIWRFSRLNENSPRGVAFKVTFKHNPHFYLELSDDAASYGSKFHKDPLKDLAYVHHGRPRTIYVLSDKSCRLYLDAAPPHRPRIFSNLWRPHRTIILKGEHSSRRARSINHMHFRCQRRFGFGRHNPLQHWGKPRLLVSPL